MQAAPRVICAGGMNIDGYTPTPSMDTCPYRPQDPVGNKGRGAMRPEISAEVFEHVPDETQDHQHADVGQIARYNEIEMHIQHTTRIRSAV